MRTLYAIAGSVAVAAASPAQAVQFPGAWATVGNWEVTPRRVGLCTATRVYPGGTRLGISRDRGGTARLSVSNLGWLSRKPGPYEMRLVQAGQAAVLTGEAERDPQGLARSAEAGETLLAQLAAGGFVEVRDSNGILLERLDLSGVGPALARLGPCTTEAATAANFPPPPPPPPPPPSRTVRPPNPKVPIHRLFSNGDYPAEAVKARQEGNVRFRLIVNKDGRVTNCVITRSSGSSILDSATCRLVRARARFTPALDVAGKPAEDVFSAVMAWRLPSLPGSPPPPPPDPK